MIIKSDYVVTTHERPSKHGTIHSYKRKKTIITFRCDCCGVLFKRERGSMDPKRLNNNVYHVCNLCDVKRFAQQKSVENKHILDLPVSSLKTIGQLK